MMNVNRHCLTLAKLKFYMYFILSSSKNLQGSMNNGQRKFTMFITIVDITLQQNCLPESIKKKVNFGWSYATQVLKVGHKAITPAHLNHKFP